MLDDFVFLFFLSRNLAKDQNTNSNACQAGSNQGLLGTKGTLDKQCDRNDRATQVGSQAPRAVMLQNECLHRNKPNGS